MQDVKHDIQGMHLRSDGTTSKIKMVGKSSVNVCKILTVLFIKIS